MAEVAAENSFSGRHLLSSGLSAPLGDRGRLDFGLVYGAGLPYAAIPLGNMEQPQAADGRSLNQFVVGEAVNAGAAPLLSTTSRPYLRVDLAASRTWAPQWGRSAVEFTPYLRLLNTLGQRDALFYRRAAEGEAFQPVLMLPVVPVVGMEWRF